MTQQTKIEVIDQSGWCKEYPLEKKIVHIGSSPRNDIVLEQGRGGGVASVHAQLIASTQTLAYQLVNLGDTHILLGEQPLSPRSAAHLTDRATFQLGEFTLIFYAGEPGYTGVAGGTSSANRYIGLGLALPRARLRPNKSLEGTITVSNLGDETGVQIHLELEGLDPDCYNIEPGPLLSSGAEKEVLLQLHHRGDKPLTGDYPITLRATAPAAYPGKEASLSRVIQVLPFYHHKLELTSPDEAKAKPVPSGAAEREPTQTKPTPPSDTQDWWADTAPESSSPPPAAESEPEADLGPLPSKKPEPAARTDSASSETWWQKLLGRLPVHRRQPEPTQEKELPPSVEPDLPPLPEIPPPPPPETTKAGPSPASESVQELLAEPAPPPPDLIREPPELSAPIPEPAQAPLAEPEPAPAPTPEPEEPEPAMPPADLIQEPAQEPPSLKPVEPEPEPVEDWWADPAEPSPAPEPPPPAEAEPAKPKPPTEEPASEPVREEWWTPKAKVSPEPDAEEPRVLKLKAPPPPEPEPEPSSPPPPAEDWWTSAPEPEPEKPAVLKLKARPSPEPEPEPSTPPAEAEEWWSDPTQKDEPDAGDESGS